MSACHSFFRGKNPITIFALGNAGSSFCDRIVHRYRAVQTAVRSATSLFYRYEVNKTGKRVAAQLSAVGAATLSIPLPLNRGRERLASLSSVPIHQNLNILPCTGRVPDLDRKSQPFVTRKPL